MFVFPLFALPFLYISGAADNNGYVSAKKVDLIKGSTKSVVLDSDPGPKAIHGNDSTVPFAKSPEEQVLFSSRMVTILLTNDEADDQYKKKGSVTTVEAAISGNSPSAPPINVSRASDPLHSESPFDEPSNGSILFGSSGKPQGFQALNQIIQNPISGKPTENPGENSPAEVTTEVPQNLSGVQSTTRAADIETTQKALNGKSAPLEARNEQSSSTPLQDLTDRTLAAKSANSTQVPNKDSSFQLNVGFTRYCTVSTDCLLDLNERCVKRGGHSTCDCPDPFLRNSLSNTCEIKRAVKLLIRFKELNYSLPMSNKRAPIYIRTTEEIEKGLYFLVGLSDVLSPAVNEVRMSNFQAISVSGGGGMSGTCLMFIREALYKRSAVLKEKLDLLIIKELSIAIHSFNASSPEAFSRNKIFDMVLQEISDVDPCQLEELNYCSTAAECVSNKFGDFSCDCKEGYTDLSPHHAHPGETCTVVCPPSFCASGGHCHVRPDLSLYCTCFSWNIGSRCQYSAVVVFSIMGVVVFLLMLVVGCSASVFCGRRAAAAQLREVSYSKPVTPTYEEHIRPFRITIDNPYDAPECLQNNNIQNDRRASKTSAISPRGSVEENDRAPSVSPNSHNYAQMSTAPATPSRTATTAAQTELNVGQIHVISHPSGFQTSLEVPSKNKALQQTWF